MLVHLSHLIENLVHLLVPSVVYSIESFYKKSIYIPYRELARLKFLSVGDGAVAFGDCLARLP